MQQLAVTDLPVVGALDIEVTSDGVVYRRLPGWTRSQLLDPALRLVVAMPAGVRLQFTTHSRSLELDLMLTVIEVESKGIYPAIFDVVVGDALTHSEQVETAARLVLRPDRSIDVLPGGPVTLRVEGLPGDGTTPVDVWLPHTAMLEVRAARVDRGTDLHPLRRARKRWAHVGSSISHCLEAPTPTAMWPAIVARRAGVELIDLALAGQCMLDPFMARTVRDLEVDLISVKAGINIVNGDTMRERTYTAALHGFLDTIRDGHPTTPLVVATPIACPEAEDHPGPTVPQSDGRYRVVPRSAALSAGALTLRRVRELMTQIVAARRANGDANLHLVDGLTLLGIEEQDSLPDGLHPDAAGYRRIAERFFDLTFTADGPFALS